MHVLCDGFFECMLGPFARVYERTRLSGVVHGRSVVVSNFEVIGKSAAVIVVLLSRGIWNGWRHPNRFAYWRSPTTVGDISEFTLPSVLEDPISPTTQGSDSS